MSNRCTTISATTVTVTTPAAAAAAATLVMHKAGNDSFSIGLGWAEVGRA